MQLIKKDGVTLAYEDINRSPGLPAMLLVHGWGCDHSALTPQAEFFSRSHRVVSVDLRGHGKSDAPHQDYTMPVFADDLAWLCTELALTKPVVIGHSMGGNIALELAARHPDIPASIVLLNSFLFLPQTFVDMLQPLAEGIKGPDYGAAYRHGMSSLFIPVDEAAGKEQLLAPLPLAPRHVLLSAFLHHVVEYDASPAAAGCRVAVAHIGDPTTTASQADLQRFQELTPQLVTAQTLGSGHFAPLLVPDQVNAMLATFIKLYSAAPLPA